MGIDLSEHGQGFVDIQRHVGHVIECVAYTHADPKKRRAAGKILHVVNVAIECVTCNEVLVSFDNPKY